MHAAPGPDHAVGVAHHDVLPGAQAVLGDLDEHVVHAGARPAAAVALVGAQQLGRDGRRRPRRPGRVLHRPAVGQTVALVEHVDGVTLEPGVLGDHGSILPYDDDGGRPDRSGRPPAVSHP